MSYEFFEHPADVKFRAHGESLEEMFIFAAGALADTVRGEIKILEQEEKNLEIEGRDLEDLLHNFLEEFLFLLDSEDFLMARIDSIQIIRPSEEGENFRLRAKVFGDLSEHYAFTNDVKAVTYSEIYVREERGKFICQVVLDV